MLLLLGNQLFAPQQLPDPAAGPVYITEDMGLCTYEKHHQQKIVLFLAAMRAYADELREAGFTVHYRFLDPDSEGNYEDRLAEVLQSCDEQTLEHFEIEDKPMEQRIVRFAELHALERTELESPMFTCARSDFAAFAGNKSRLLMGDFYKQQRQRLDILVHEDEPVGGQWSFDTDNRKKLPRDVALPNHHWPEPDGHVSDVIELVAETFAEHPGDAREFRWPTTRKQAQDWLGTFVAHRLDLFGPYEDAMTTRSRTVFHSLLSPFLNIGLLTPQEVVDKALEQQAGVQLQSLEGFVRQIIGWREFIRGIYREYSEVQEDTNFFGHERELTFSWYEGTTGIAPLDDTIETVRRLGWTHHIPRLMIVANLMTLCEIRPAAAHRWFMEMFIDSSEWVMGPNVYGMGLFSDGGIFATKPYICGSNYLRKMSDYGKGDWCDTVDGLYWRFIGKHRDFFKSNPRLAIMPRALERLGAERRAKIFAAAEDFLEQHTLAR